MKNLTSKSILMRLVEEQDAEFILSLRLNQNLNTFLSKVNADVEAQSNWIRHYKEDEAKGKQYYFIVERLDGIRCGTVRLYDFTEDSFSWGSWILNNDKTRYAAIENAFLVYEFGFDVLGFNKSHFEVMKGNDRVIAFHEKLGAIRVNEDDTNIYFEINKDIVDIQREKFKVKVL